MKKRILSLILALSMVLSVLPLGAFAEGSTQDLVMGANGLPDCSNGTSGNGWEYSDGTLTLTRGTFDFSSTHPQGKTPGTPTTTPVACAIEIQSGAEITDGTFNATVYNGQVYNGQLNSPGGTISNGTFNGTVISNGIITGNGTFEGEVINHAGTISGGTFKKKVVNNANGTISDGTFHEKVLNYNGRIANGTFKGDVTNWDKITSGTFSTTVTNNYGGTISGGTFAGSVENQGNVTGGVFNDNANLINVTGGHNITWDAASSKAKIEKVNDVPAEWDPYVCTGTTVTITADTEIFSLNGKPIGTDYNSSYPNTNDKKTVKFTMPDKNVVLNEEINYGDFIMKDGYPEASNGGKTSCKGDGWEYDSSGILILKYGTYDFSSTHPQNPSAGTRPAPAVQCAIYIQPSAEITDGTFSTTVNNYTGGTISGGTFAAGLSDNYGTVTGGVFNGNTALTDARHVTVTDGSLLKVNGVDPRNADGTTGTAWDLYSYAGTTMTITANTEIFSLNGQPIGTGNCNSSYGVDKKTVTFTMPSGNVVLNGAITSTDLVMEKGRPEASNEGKISCSGTGWSYDHNTDTLTLTSNSGTYDFSLANPQDTTKTTSADSAVACAIVIESGAEITGGTFNGKVTNNAGGIISGGIFQETCSVTNNGTIKNGTFKDVCSVTNEGANATIENGTFKNMCRVINNSTIKNGTFKNKCSVENNNTIENGTFAGSVTNSGTVTGGVFNGNATLINVTGGHNITWDAASSKAKIEKVNGVPAEWEPYVVVTQWTKSQEVTITASTEIFSLNGQPIGAGNCNSSYGSDRTTVTFTMPDDDVVLNEEINYGDLVMENGWPKDSDGGKNPCKGDGWQYIPNDPTNGNMLLLTGSNQTGGLFDFSTIGDGSAVECNVFVGKPTAITGGEFNGKVFNNSGILDGTFHGEVDNRAPGIIKGGTFNGAVENNGTIEKGTFKNMCSVTNNAGGTISDGTFAGSVTNSGTVTGGIFNGNTGLDGVTDLHSITWDAASSNAKIEKVNGVSAAWAPYVVTSNATTKEVTITADTEIFSLNGQPIAESSYGVDKKTVTFTMPDDDVVLNGELITKPEPEPEPKPEPKPEPEPTTYTVTVIGGTIDGKTSVSAKENDTLTVVLDQNEIPDGMTFDMWSISSSKLSGDINVDYRAEAMTFQMPAEDVTIRAQYRSAEIIEDAAPSPLATAATIAVGGAAAGIVVWQGVNLGVDLYLANALPQGVPVPTDRRALALLLWETAGKPEVALPTLYGDIPAEEIELQKATHWAVQNGLMDAADKKDASFFDPDHYVTKMDVFGAWLRLKKLLGTIGTSPTQ